MNAPAPTRPTHEAQVAAGGGSIHDFRKATRKMRSWYESLADYMIVHPTISNAELARHFGRAESTISTVVNTDSFKMYFRNRRAQHESTLDATVRQKLFKIADASLDHMLAALEKKRDNVPLETLQRTSDMALKNLGYGAAAPSGVTVNVDQRAPQTVNVAVSLDDLERAREALRRNQLAPPIEVEYTEVESPALGGSAMTSSPGSSPGARQDEPEPKARLEDLA
jgi:CHAD domain